MSSRTLIVFVIAVAAGIATFVLLQTRGGGGIRPAAAECDESPRSCLPELNFLDIDGNMLTAESLKGKVVMVNFWATWCKPCIKEIPDLVDAYAKYRDQGFELVGVVEGKVSQRALAAFVKRNKMNYPVVLLEQYLYEKFDYPSSWPTTFLYDRTGKNRLVRRGPIHSAELDRILPKLLESK